VVSDCMVQWGWASVGTLKQFVFLDTFPAAEMLSGLGHPSVLGFHDRAHAADTVHIGLA
ncbi:uncharacterized protein METZ01_LOCUS496681, partial [marine metagenome]